MTRGRPLRFLALVLGGWAGLRALLLWPGEAAPVRLIALTTAPASGSSAAVNPPPGPSGPAAVVGHGHPSYSDDGPGSAVIRQMARAGTSPRATSQPDSRLGRRRDVVNATIPEALPAFAVEDAGPAQMSSSPDSSVGSVAVPPPILVRARHAASPLHGGTWLIARPTGGDNLAFGQLGASQAGARVTYTLSDARRVALSLRVSAPLRGVGREAAAGIDWQPTRLPIHLLGEQRIPLDGGKSRPAMQVIGGGALRLPLRLVAEAYAQAGGVYRRGGFADGSAQVSRALISRALFTLDLGGGVWGAAQRRVSRLDLGPALGLTLPARGGSVRLGVDYRLRVAGRARPGSGPAVSLGSSF